MSAEILQKLLAGTLPDPDAAGHLSVTTRMVVISPSLQGQEGLLLRSLSLGRRLALIADPATYRVLGERVFHALAAEADVKCEILGERPHADSETLDRVVAAANEIDALIAVGSGTINDLTKMAAHRLGRPYVVFGTAPSMNGYASVNAAITVGGHKKSLPATAPLAILLDLEVLSGAPPRMIQAGFGDSICRSTAQADWLLAHLLLDQPYRTAPFQLLQADEAGLLAEAPRLADGDLLVMARLARTLVLSGFGMSICGGSYPASQGEHLIAHYLEMMAPEKAGQSFHGEQIAVTTLTMARLQERMLSSGAPALKPSEITEAQVLKHFGPVLGAACWQSLQPKLLDEARAQALSDRLDRDWPDIRSAILPISRSSREIDVALRSCGAPTHIADLDIGRELYDAAVLHARECRDRFTFLDLAAESGLLPAFVETAQHC